MIYGDLTLNLDAFFMTLRGIFGPEKSSIDNWHLSESLFSAFSLFDITNVSTLKVF